MPELPEVETMRRGILSACGATIQAVHRPRCKKKPITVRPDWATLRRKAVNGTIESIGRVGKRLLIHLGEHTIVIEPRMSGLVLTEQPPTSEHLRMELRLAGGDCEQIRFWDRRGLGTVSLLNRQELDAFLNSGRLGPDALQITSEQLREGLGSRSIAIKVGLLDQAAVAGVGNIYASELLHRARVHPARACQTIARSKWLEIHRQMLNVLELAIQSEGSTLYDGTYRNALNTPGRFQNCFRVYDRAGQRCLTCRRGRIRRIVQAQRSTYFCPKCQPAPRSSSRR